MKELAAAIFPRAPWAKLCRRPAASRRPFAFRLLPTAGYCFPEPPGPGTKGALRRELAGKVVTPSGPFRDGRTFSGKGVECHPWGWWSGWRWQEARDFESIGKAGMSRLTESEKLSEPEAADDPNEQLSFPPLGSALKVLMVWPRFPSSFWADCLPPTGKKESELD